MSNAAGWEAMKRARGYIAQDQVLSSSWTPPLLKGVVQVNGMSFRASMVIESEIDIENLCTCRDARESGIICAHSVAVGLHWLEAQKPAASHPGLRAPTRPASPAPEKSRGLSLDPAGLPAELRVILPPGIERSIAAGKIMLVIEAESGGRVSPLNALSRDKSYAFPPQDSTLLRTFEELAGGDPPAMLQLSVDAFSGLLPGLAGFPRITLGRSEPVKVSDEPLDLALRATLQPNGEILLEPGKLAQPITTVGDWCYSERTFRPLGLDKSSRNLLKAPVLISRPQVPSFLATQWPRFASKAESNFALSDFAFDPAPPKFLLQLGGGLAQLTGVLQCSYGSRIMTPAVTSSAEEAWMPDPDHPTRYGTRDLASEREALARLHRSGFVGPDERGRLVLAGQNAILNFFARDYPRLVREWSVTLEERLDRSTRQNIEQIEPRFTVTPSGVQWFDLGVVFASSSGQRFSQSDIQKLLLSGQSHMRLPNGKSAVIDTEALDEFQEALRDCAPRQHEGGYRIGNAHVSYLESTLRERAGWKMTGYSAPAENWNLDSAVPHLATILRPYQRTGTNWLWFLRSNSFGGILADEMGLGKTLQTLAYFQAVRATQPTSGPMLVVCPTSLVTNWISEAQRFTPSLRALAIQGPDRKGLFENIRSHDLVVTSYALIRRDAEHYRSIDFDTVVLDEAQHIKNRQTQNAQAVKSIRAAHRFVLTGTPLENSVLDLWSIFDFLMPGYLGTAQDFRERYEQPITRDKDQRVQNRLSRRLRPFLLRRLKRDVATELPEKLQQVSYCEMTSDQREVYQQLIESTRKEVLDAVGEQGLARSRMIVLSALLRLRQACCDLRLLKLEGLDPGSTSGKLDLFAELIEEVIDGGHRALVFSQFTSMLAILREHLADEQIAYCYLDGSTQNRASVVDQFQRDGSIPVFLISLKAGGVGLNLTGADTVIHYDPWWNPAVEDQATDRAHRIGQTRVVTSYKLITRGTIEEKILALQERKRELIQAMIAGEEQFASALTWDEIQELLS